MKFQKNLLVVAMLSASSISFAATSIHNATDEKVQAVVKMITTKDWVVDTKAGFLSLDNVPAYDKNNEFLIEAGIDRYKFALGVQRADGTIEVCNDSVSPSSTLERDYLYDGTQCKSLSGDPTAAITLVNKGESDTRYSLFVKNPGSDDYTMDATDGAFFQNGATKLYSASSAWGYANGVEQGDTFSFAVQNYTTGEMFTCAEDIVMNGHRRFEFNEGQCAEVTSSTSQPSMVADGSQAYGDIYFLSVESKDSGRKYHMGELGGHSNESTQVDMSQLIDAGLTSFSKVNILLEQADSDTEIVCENDVLLGGARHISINGHTGKCEVSTRGIAQEPGQVAAPGSAATLYEHGNHRGKTMQISTSMANLGAMNSMISGQEIPEGWTLRFFDQINYQGAFVDRTAQSEDNAFMSNFNDRAQSVQVLKTGDSVLIYEHSRQTGRSLILQESIADLGHFSNIMSSFEIPAGWSVRFYEEPNFQGAVHTRDANSSDAWFTSSFNDVIKSIEIVRNAQ